jgi:hypothetical protein
VVVVDASAPESFRPCGASCEWAKCLPPAPPRQLRTSPISISIGHADLDLLGRTWRLRDNVTAYDALYVALAEAIEAPLVTCDGLLARALGHRARIEVIV